MSSAASPPPADLVALALVAGLILDTSSSAGTAWTFASSARGGANKKKSSRRKPARGTELPASLADLVSLVSVDGCGLGLIAKRAFSSGERILAEYPLLRWVVSADDIGSGGEVSPAALDRQVEALEDAKRVAYFSLSQSAMFGTEKSAGGIWMCNAFPVPGENEAQRGVQSAGVFEVICRINHSCSPNTHHQWNTKLGKMTLHAIRPISHGEEITIACTHERNTLPWMPCTLRLFTPASSHLLIGSLHAPSDSLDRLAGGIHARRTRCARHAALRLRLPLLALQA